MEHLIAQLLDATQRNNTILYGESGSGKSLFLIKLIQSINDDQRFKNFDMVYIKLRELSAEGNKALPKLL
jgi:DNA replication protein DnaC